MQQRQPRLGDILDDYCPRERRVTNHAVVAMVGQDVKQTRCTTCDAEHEFKNARVPAQRKKKTGPGALYDEVLTGMPRKLAPATATPPEPLGPEPAAEAESTHGALVVPAAALPSAPEAVESPSQETVRDAASTGDEHDGPVHRPLIRATLPRPEGQVKERPIPEFTARTAAARAPGRFRQHGAGQGLNQGQPRGRGGHAHSTNGNPAAGNPFGRRGPGHGQFAAAGVPGHGNRPHAPQAERHGQHRPGGRKRSK
jgi:hypothetical protein